MEIIIITNTKDTEYMKQQNDYLIKYLRKADYGNKLKPNKVKRDGPEFITHLIYKK
jgi:hypothetical protein